MASALTPITTLRALRLKQAEGPWWGEPCWNAGLSKSPMFWLIQNTHGPRRRRERAFAPCSRFRCCAKGTRSACSCWRVRSCGRSRTSSELVTTFADQAVIAIENVRLFEEIQDTSRQLAEASEHKSQFVASMSHELRT